MLAQKFLDHGYNVLSFDFRATRPERRPDHLLRRSRAAGRAWRRTLAPRFTAAGQPAHRRDRHRYRRRRAPRRSRRPIVRGPRLGALAVFGCYDRFDDLAASAAQMYHQPVLQWLVVQIGIPLACIQTGADLYDFSPADAAARVAPRPILFVHGRRDMLIDFDRGRSLYEAASAPKVFSGSIR